MNHPRIQSGPLPGAREMGLVVVSAWMDTAEKHLLNRKVELAFSDQTAALGYLFLAAAKAQQARRVIEQIEAEDSHE